MCTIAVWDSRLEGAAELIKTIKASPRLSNDIMKLGRAPSAEEIGQCDVFIISYDAKYESALAVAQTVRSRNAKSLIILIASRHEALMPLIRPSIRASGALIRPFEARQLVSMLEEATEEFRRSVSTPDTFVIKTGGTTCRFDMREIIFLESRGKKIVLRTLGQEISFYDTLESLEKRLPNYFLRCHRGFLVNSRFIESVQFTESLVYLKGECMVPLSRSCKTAVREWMVSK